MRRKMGMEAPAPATPSPMDEAAGGPGDNQAEESNEGSDATTILPKALGGGKQWKEGEEIVLKILAVDPESGDMQVKYAPEKPDSSSEEPTDTMSAMDQKLPAGDEGGGY